MSYLSKFPRRTLVGLLLFLLAGGAFLQLRLGAAAERDRIVYLRLTGKYWQLWMMDADGRNARQLTTSPVDKHSPTWCPGNAVIHFATARGDNVLLELATGKEHRQVPLLTGVEPPRGPDGNPLPFDVDVRKILADRGFTEFARVSCGDGAEPLAEVVEIRAPSGLPEGTGIVVQKRLSPERKPLYEINVVDLADRAGMEALRSTGGRADSKRVVSKTGTLAFVSDVGGGDEIWTAPGDDIPKPLTDLASRVNNPFWSHDGTFIYFESDYEGTRQIYRAWANGDAMERLTDGRAPSRSAALSRATQATP